MIKFAYGFFMNTEFSPENVKPQTVKVSKPSMVWYAVPLLLGILGSTIMWYSLRGKGDSSKEMLQQGWIIGIVLTLVGLAWLPIIMGLNAS